jgi:hypothetical protein
MGMLLCVLSGLTAGAESTVTLAWDRVADTNVVGYRVHYGVASRTYTNAIQVGNLTTNRVTGLVENVRYYLAVTACDAQGVESDFSNEVTFTPGPGVTQVKILLNRKGGPVLHATGQPNRSYDILATGTFSNWTVVGTTTSGSNGSLTFVEPGATNFPARFYRLRETTK